MVKNGTYTKDGQEKNRWVQIGVLGESQNGQYVILEPHINLAGLPRSEKGGVMVSVFDDQQQQGGYSQQGQGGYSQQGGYGQQNDDLPFG